MIIVELPAEAHHRIVANACLNGHGSEDLNGQGIALDVRRIAVLCGNTQFATLSYHLLAVGIFCPPQVAEEATHGAIVLVRHRGESSPVEVGKSRKRRLCHGSVVCGILTPKFTCKGTYEMRAKRATGAPLTSATHVIQHGAGDLIAVGLSLHGSREWREDVTGQRLAERGIVHRFCDPVAGLQPEYPKREDQSTSRGPVAQYWVKTYLLQPLADNIVESAWPR